MKKLLLYTLLIPCLFLSIYPSLLLAAEQSDKIEVNIGVIAPFTGQFAYVGDEINRMAEILLPKVNSDSKMYHYSLIRENGGAGIGGAAQTAAKKLIHVDKVKFLLTGTSGETFLAGPIAEENKVLDIAVIANHKDIKHLGDYIFRTFVDIEDGIGLIAKTIMNDGQTPVAILTEDNAFTQGMRKLLEEALGDKVSLSLEYLPGEVDLRTLLLKVKNDQAKSIYFNCAGPLTCTALINQVKQLGIEKPVYSYIYTEHKDVLKAVGENANGIKYGAFPIIAETSEEFQDFMKEYLKRHPEGAGYEFLLRTSYDALSLMTKGIEAVGDDPTKVKEFLYSYMGKGAIGDVEFDQNGDPKNLKHIMKVIVDGKPEIIQIAPSVYTE